MVPQSQQDTCERQDLLIEPNSCFSDLSDSLHLLNSLKVLLHLGKTTISFLVFVSQTFVLFFSAPLFLVAPAQ